MQAKEGGGLAIGEYFLESEKVETETVLPREKLVVLTLMLLT